VQAAERVLHHRIKGTRGALYSMHPDARCMEVARVGFWGDALFGDDVFIRCSDSRTWFPYFQVRHVTKVPQSPTGSV
jgi:hypothetical protein